MTVRLLMPLLHALKKPVHRLPLWSFRTDAS